MSVPGDGCLGGWEFHNSIFLLEINDTERLLG